jgi:hypothetical protein
VQSNDRNPAQTDCLKLLNWILKKRLKCGLDTYGSGQGQVLVFVHMTVDF